MMKSLIKQVILPTIASMCPTARWINLTEQRLIHVFYHTVSDEYLLHIHPLYRPKTIDEFMKDLNFLLQYFKPIDAEEVIKHYLQGQPITQPSFHLSFDDGLSEIYHHVFPILYKKGISATLFINSAFVDNKALFYRYKIALIIDKIQNKSFTLATSSKIHSILELAQIKGKNWKDQLLRVNYYQQSVLDEIAQVLDINFNLFLQKQRPYLTLSELKELQNKGFTIGAHSVDHPPFSILDEKEQIRQTVESCQFVQTHLSEKNRLFAFPFSDMKVQPSFFNSIHSQIDITFGISGIKKAEYQGKHLHRIDMERGDKSARRCINSCYMTYYLL